MERLRCISLSLCDFGCEISRNYKCKKDNTLHFGYSTADFPCKHFVISMIAQFKVCYKCVIYLFGLQMCLFGAF